MPWRDAQLWGERYNRGFADVFAVQEEMATAISSSLQLRLSGDDRQQLARHPTRDSQAYEAYHEGPLLLEQAPARRLSARHRFTFRKRSTATPTSLLAYTGLADTLNLLGYYNHRPPSTCIRGPRRRPRARSRSIPRLPRRMPRSATPRSSTIVTGRSPSGSSRRP
jgi:hypothetical protein